MTTTTTSTPNNIMVIIIIEAIIIAIGVKRVGHNITTVRLAFSGKIDNFNAQCYYYYYYYSTLLSSKTATHHLHLSLTVCLLNHISHSPLSYRNCLYNISLGKCKWNLENFSVETRLSPPETFQHNHFQPSQVIGIASKLHK